MHRESDDFGVRELSSNDAGCIESVKNWHVDVHQHYAWSVRFDCLNGSYQFLLGIFPRHNLSRFLLGLQGTVHEATVIRNQ